MAAEIAPDVMTYYESTFNEGERLSASADGRLEMLRTQELLRRYLQAATARILDVGGGPGTHARRLAEDGHDVLVVDPVPRHVREAEQVPGCAAVLGDARELSVADASFDVVLVLGPLYHLLERDDRAQALTEAYRVLRPGGLIAAAGINRCSSLFEHTAHAHLHEEGVRASIDGILASRVHDGKKAFTAACLHSGGELRDEVTAAGFREAQVFGVEGPVWSLLKAVESHTGEPVVGTALFDSALAAARMAEPYPELPAAGSHMLAIAHRPR
ncbi:SAM-dependent methyltransferase [Streptomyces nanshensis]|nr:SAM-dependent methyltransferase [Streptomyces nanshensis]